MEDILLTFQEAIDTLQVSKPTIYKHIREGRLNPSMGKDKIYFHEAEVQQLKKQKQKPGLTTGEVAKLLDISMAKVQNFINKGLLRAEKKAYQGKDRYFIEPAELERFKSNQEQRYTRSTSKDFYDKSTGYAWFQQFKDQKGNKDSRILLDSGIPFLVTFENKKIPVIMIDTLGFTPISPISDKEYITKRGYAKFTFEIGEDFFQTIEVLYQHLGYKNIRMLVDGGMVHVDIKPIKMENVTAAMIKYLREHLVEGRIYSLVDGVAIESEVDTLTVTIPVKLKELIKQKAKAAKIPMEEFAVDLITVALKVNKFDK